MMEPKRSGDVDDAENDDGDSDTLFALAMQQNADAVADQSQNEEYGPVF